MSAEGIVAAVGPLVEACVEAFDLPELVDEEDVMEPAVGITLGMVRRAREALEAWPADAERYLSDLEREREIWSVQSRVIRALAAEVPDDVRERVLAPLRDIDQARRPPA